MKKKIKPKKKRRIKETNDFFKTGIVYIDPRYDKPESKRKHKKSKSKPKSKENY